jgi:hypothetical protein
MPIQPSSSDAPSVYVAWQDPGTREWHTIARLSHSTADQYEFGFTRGAEKLRDVAKQLFNSNLEGHFFSTGLTALFRNKIPPRSRSDFSKLANWLNLTGKESDFEMLGKFGLFPGTDGLLVYPAPLVGQGRYSIEFFIHGIRHTHGDSQARHLHGDVLTWCETAKVGDQLYALLDVQNQFDANSVALRADGGTIAVGYVPRFYASDLRLILGQPEFAKSARFELLRNNVDAPLQFRMLCRFTSNVPIGFLPLDDTDHEMRPTLVPFEN